MRFYREKQIFIRFLCYFILIIAILFIFYLYLQHNSNNSTMEISARVRKLCDKYNMEPEDVAYADLQIAGWGKHEAAYYAYNLAYFDMSKINTWLKDKVRLAPGIQKMVNDFDEAEKLRKREEKENKLKLSAKQRKAEQDAAKNQEITAESLRDKKGMLDYLINLAATPGLDLKTKADLAKQITDLQNYKKEDSTEIIDNRIHFYLPLVCSKCSLYVKHKELQKERKEQEINNTEGD